VDLAAANSSAFCTLNSIAVRKRETKKKLSRQIFIFFFLRLDPVLPPGVGRRATVRTPPILNRDPNWDYGTVLISEGFVLSRDG